MQPPITTTHAMHTCAAGVTNSTVAWASTGSTVLASKQACHTRALQAGLRPGVSHDVQANCRRTRRLPPG